MNILIKHKFVSITAAVFLLVLIFGFFQASDPKPEDSLDKLIDQVAKETNSNIEDIEVVAVANNYARAKKRSTQSDLFIFKSESNWKIIFEFVDSYFCEDVVFAGFPDSLISDCILKYPKSIFIDDLEDEILEKGDGVYSIVAKINESQDPFCDCLSVNSGGTTIEIPIDNQTSYQPGETILVEVVIEEGEIITNSPAQNPNEENQSNNNSNNQESQSSDPSIISGQQNLFLRFIDIDHSDRIRILND
jgi:thiol-disulfide isomerase/thioredoxin